jgi:ketosteroid isomerase-like protein
VRRGDETLAEDADVRIGALGCLLGLLLSAAHAADTGKAATHAAEQAMVAEVLATNARMVDVVLHNRADELGQFFAKDCLVHGSSNRISDCAEVVESFRSGQLRFRSYERNIERTLVSGDVVVLMGEELVVPAEAPAGAAPVHRRITSAWRKIDGRWQQFARQSTVVAAH